MERGCLRTCWKVAKQLSQRREPDRGGNPTAEADLESGSPLHVKDDASATLRAKQPLPLSAVAQPERAATNRPLRHEYRAARAEGDLPALYRLAHGLLLSRREACRFAHRRTTTLPNCAPDDSRSKALADSSIGQTESTGGIKSPSRNRAVMASNSTSFPMVDPISVH